jgi:CRP/FNR family transcriptional regulator, cyclic AMP receptor protein
VRQADEIERCAEELRHVALFRELDQERLVRVAGLCTLVQRAAGDQLAVESADAHHIFILCAGEVSITKQLSLPQLRAVERADRTLTKLSGEAHPMLGEAALLVPSKRRATVTCVTDCVLYTINAQELKQLMEEDPAAGYIVYKRLAYILYDRLELANNDVVKLSAALVFALED